MGGTQSLPLLSTRPSHKKFRPHRTHTQPVVLEKLGKPHNTRPMRKKNDFLTAIAQRPLHLSVDQICTSTQYFYVVHKNVYFVKLTKNYVDRLFFGKNAPLFCINNAGSDRFQSYKNSHVSATKACKVSYASPNMFNVHIQQLKKWTNVSSDPSDTNQNTIL